MDLKQRVKIIDFAENLHEPIKTLNYEWLEKFFKVEERDVLSLSNPKQQIIDKGGFIFYAMLDDQVVGTASLLKLNNYVFELSKMAVTESARGYGIGKLLVQHCVDYAKKLHLKKLILYSNTKLASAIHLYRKFGFIEVSLEDGVYERANIKMEKSLH